jgi:hypothetical protein
VEGDVTLALLGGLFGWVVGGLPLAVVMAVSTRFIPSMVPKPSGRSDARLVLLLLLVELRSGLSVLAAMQSVSLRLDDDVNLRAVVRVATVSGLTRSIELANPALRPVIAQLARAQRSGSSLSTTVRLMLDQDIASDRARRLSRARALPVRLMIPMTLLVLPGLVLMLYAPSLLGLLDDLTGTWS